MRRSTATAMSARGATQVLGHPAQQHRAGVVGLVDGVAEAHDPVAPLDRVADPGTGPLRCADGVEEVEGPAGCAAVQRAGQGAQGTDHRSPHVGAGGGDDPRREGRGVEPVVDGEHQVLLHGPGHLGGGFGAVDHPQVVGGVAEVGPGRDRLLTRATGGAGRPPRWASPPPAGSRRPAARRRRCRRSGGTLRPRPPPTAPCAGRPAGRGPEPGRRRPGPPRRGRRAGAAPAATSAAKAARARPLGQGPVDEQGPHVLEGAALGQLDPGVLAVVEEPLLAPHVADLGLGHHHPLQAGTGPCELTPSAVSSAGTSESNDTVPVRSCRLLRRRRAARAPGSPGGSPSWHVGGDLARRADVGDAHEVAERHDADQGAVVDHREVAVAPLGQEVEGVVHGHRPAPRPGAQPSSTAPPGRPRRRPGPRRPGRGRAR